MKTFYIGIKGLIRDKEKGVLLLHKAGGQDSFWEAPGGRMDDGESFEQTLTRELSEELPGISNIQIGKLLGTHHVTEKYTNDIGLVLLFFDVTASLPSPLTLSDEHQGAQFFKPGENLPDSVNDTLKELISGLKD